MKKYSIKLISCLCILIGITLNFNVCKANSCVCEPKQTHNNQKQILKSYRKNEIRRIKKKIEENENHIRNLESIRKSLDDSLVEQIELNDNLMLQISNYPYKNCRECKILKNQSRYIENKIQSLKRSIRANERKIDEAKKTRDKLEREISNLLKNEKEQYEKINRCKCYVI